MVDQGPKKKDRMMMKVVPFERHHQQSVQELFVAGLTSQPPYALQAWFVQRKLESEMCDVFTHYCSDKGGKGVGFFVAVQESESDDDNANKIVIGMIGLCKPGYVYTADEVMYAGSIQEGELLELVRMSVHKDYRKQKVGSQLLAAVESKARAMGAKRLALSTLTVMDAAKRFYSANGFKFAKETTIDMQSLLGPQEDGTPRRVEYVYHMFKDLV